ncbi:response regulator transcription factor [Melittangium boletus]|uniref:response regulator transcription factor n=1 Tax=Melittangium boletus TaxID=83453 RepID=UPI003DA62570
MGERIRLGILEDQQVFRESLMALFEDSGMQVVAAGGTVDELLGQLGTESLDVAVVDLRLERAESWAVDSGLRLVELLRERNATTRALVLSAHREVAVLERCFQAGAVGYLCKLNVSSARLVSAVQQVARGEWLVPPELVVPGRPASAEHASPLDKLTQREREVLSMVASGADNLQIAARLGITERTVKAHVSNLYRKLEVQNRVEMAMVMYQSQPSLRALEPSAPTV